MEVIDKARPSKPFMVRVMKQEDFRDISELEKHNQRPKNFKITEAMGFHIRKDDPSSIYSRKSHNTLQPWTVYPIKKRSSLTHAPVSNLFPLLYENVIPLKKVKKDNLLDMAKYIEDREIRQFYMLKMHLNITNCVHPYINILLMYKIL